MFVPCKLTFHRVFAFVHSAGVRNVLISSGSLNLYLWNIISKVLLQGCWNFPLMWCCISFVLVFTRVCMLSRPLFRFFIMQNRVSQLQVLFATVQRVSLFSVFTLTYTHSVFWVHWWKVPSWLQLTLARHDLILSICREKNSSPDHSSYYLLFNNVVVVVVCVGGICPDITVLVDWA